MKPQHILKVRGSTSLDCGFPQSVLSFSQHSSKLPAQSIAQHKLCNSSDHLQTATKMQWTCHSAAFKLMIVSTQLGLHSMKISDSSVNGESCLVPCHMVILQVIAAARGQGKNHIHVTLNVNGSEN